MHREEFCEVIKTIVCGDRDEQYGGPEDNFSNIADWWSAYLDFGITSEDVAVMMILMKVARLQSSNFTSEDSWIDIAGYAACGCEIADRRKAVK